jgi:hypothetical protein
MVSGEFCLEEGGLGIYTHVRRNWWIGWEVVILDEDDNVKWALEKDGVYSTRSMYRFLSLGGVTSRRMQGVWSAKIPMKVRVLVADVL